MSQVLRVLVVDDEESIRFSLQRFLTDAGFHVSVASHPVDAKEMLPTIEFDVAVVDRILGDGEDGVDLVKHIKSVQPFCQTILISAYPSFESAAESLRSEAFAYLAKPVKRDEICQVTQEAAMQSKSRKERDSRARTMETQLLQASKMTSIGQLVSGIAHDFKNVLQVIAGYMDLLLANKQTAHPDYAKLKEIENVCQEGKQLVMQLLDSCGEREPSFEIIDINPTLQKVASLLTKTMPKNIQVGIRLSDALSPVSADPHQIHQCILNLAINARDAILEKRANLKNGRETEQPQIIIAAEDVILDEKRCEQLSGLTPGKYVLITVSDTGIGMAEDVRKRIFEPLFTTKASGKGTGFGLSMAYSIIKNHRGTVHVDSEPEKGTTLSIFLPAAEMRDPLSRVIGSKEPDSTGGRDENLLRTE